jgi:hypothetical protein
LNADGNLELEISAEAGTVYYIIVDGFSGPYTLSVDM